MFGWAMSCIFSKHKQAALRKANYHKIIFQENLKKSLIEPIFKSAYIQVCQGDARYQHAGP
jgi:hypothetical protein